MRKLKVEHLVKKYRGRAVVKGVSFQVKQGEIVGLLGPNGAGKTTSFYMTVGLIKPNEGRVLLDKEDITSDPMYKRAQKGIGYLAQEASVFRKLSVEENILGVLQMTGKARSEQEAKLESLLDECGMPAGDVRELLITDIHDLVSHFADITRSEFVDVRLERISHDSCWKFHRDNVAARLLTTYRGPATEWIRAPYAEQALREPKEFNGPVETLHRNDVAIFKGSAAGSGNGIVHRSPPIVGTGRTRLLLCLNQRTEISPAPWPQSDDTEAWLR